MNIRKPTRRRPSGFTLVEMTLVIFMALQLSVALMILLNQHLVMFRAANQANFLVQEAPGIGALMNRILNQVDHYYIYTNKSDAINGTNPVNSGGSVVKLSFRTPSGTPEEGIIAYESVSGTNSLGYYARKDNSWPDQSSWVITSRPTQVTFSNSTGILLVQLVGPLGEEITYAGTSQ